MNAWLLLLSPRIMSFANRIRRGEDGSGLRLLIMGLVALGFWIAIFYGFFKVLAYFQAAEGFGDILARKLMGMLWLTFMAVLLFSNVITALSTFYLSKDLELVHAAPVSIETIFWARLTDTLIDSSWMVLFFGIPIFLAYGIVFDAGFLYYVKLVAAAAPVLAICTAASVIFTMILVNVFPAQRTKDILFLLGIMGVIILYLLFRFMKPERLVNPNEFATMVGYFASLNTPSSPYLPSHWASEVLWPSLVRETYSEAGFYLIMLISTAAAMATAASWLANAIYGQGYSKAQEGARQQAVAGFDPVHSLAQLFALPFASNSRALVVKDIKTFFRDNTQWSQLLLLVAMIVIYLYNFMVLDLRKSPVPTFHLQNILSFLNIALAAFVVASLGVRFVFPAVSMEGFSWWIIRSSPMSLNRFLWTKYSMYLWPLLIVAEILIVLSNYLLDVTPMMMIISTITVFFLTLGIVGLGVGLGAVYPRFEAENIAAVATGFGGIIYMIACAIYVALVVMMEAWPVYILFRSQLYGFNIHMWQKVLIGLCFAGVMVVNAAAVFAPMHLGKKRLMARESG